MDTKFVVEVNHDDLEFEIDRIAEFEYEFDNLHIIDVSEDLKQELVVVPTTEQQVIVPEGDQVYDKVTVEPIQPPFVDVSDTTATPEDVSSGKVFYDATGTRQEGVVGADDDLFLCRVIDWEGTILKEEWLPSGATFTMPSDPTYEGLVFDGWSGTVDVQDNAVVVEDMDLIFGAMYHTASGLTEIDIELNEATGLSVQLYLSGTKDWGDGTSDTSTTHTYADYGKYTISGSLSPIRNQTTGRNYYKSIRFATGFNFTSATQGWFQSSINLESLLLPKGMTRVGLQWFNISYNLKGVVIPNTVIDIGDAFASSGLKTLVVPNSVTYFSYNIEYTNIEYLSIKGAMTISGSYFVNSSNNLKRVFVDVNNITSSSGILQSCCNLEKAKIKIREGTTLSAPLCYYCYSLKKLELIADNLTTTKLICASCYTLKEIILPNSITQSGSICSNCVNLEYIKLPENLTTASEISPYAYNLKEIVFPTNLETCGNFANQTYSLNLAEVNFPTTLTTIGDFGLNIYSDIFNIPPNLTKIGSMQGTYTGAGTVELPDSISSMGNIRDWRFVEKIVMPASLTAITNNSFGYNLVNCKCYDFSKCSVVPTLAYSSSNTFRNKNPLMRIVVPDALYDEWIVATNWTAFQSYIVKASEYKGE